MLNVILIGTGNIARFLFDVLSKQSGITISEVLGRNENALDYFRNSVPVSNDFTRTLQADVYILAVSDEAIHSVAHLLNFQGGLLVHTAGSISMEALPEKVRRGVFYPLQTLSGIIPEKMRDIPICIEASGEKDYEVLEDLAHRISDLVVHVNSAQRKQLHLAAVFANNFSNHLFYLASEICEDQGVSFDLLRPLIRESCSKVLQVTPFEAQTGPARRGDEKTLDAHLQMLQSPHTKMIYKTLSESIQRTYGKEL